MFGAIDKRSLKFFLEEGVREDAKGKAAKGLRASENFLSWTFWPGAGELFTEAISGFRVHSVSLAGVCFNLFKRNAL